MENKTQSARLLGPALAFSTLILVSFVMGCVKKSLDTPTETATATPTPTPTPVASKYLYVATGACNGGSNTTFTSTTASNLVYRINATTGQRDLTLADYWTAPANPGDSPVGIVDSTNDSILVAIENSTTVGLRRIERIPKSTSGTRTTFSSNIAALASQIRGMSTTSNGDLLISRTAGVELITQSNIRIGAPYLSPTGTNCGTSNTGVSRGFMIGSRAVVLHAATGQNRVITLSPTPATNTICNTGTQTPTLATAFPIAAFYDAANSKIVVAYSGNATTVNLNYIIAYPFTDSATNTLGAGTKIYDASDYPSAAAPFLLYAISEMVYDASTSSVYIATATTTATTVANYQIEKFTYDGTKIGVDNTKVLTRVPGSTFYPYGNDTKCISQMMIAD